MQYFAFFIFVILSYQNTCYGCEKTEKSNMIRIFFMMESFGGSEVLFIF